MSSGKRRPKKRPGVMRDLGPSKNEIHHFRAPGHGGHTPICKNGCSTGDVLWDRWNKVTCEKCLALKPKRIHHGVVNKRGNIVATQCGLERVSVEERTKKGPLQASLVTTDVTCQRCLKLLDVHIFESRDEGGVIVWYTGCGTREFDQPTDKVEICASDKCKQEDDPQKPVYDRRLTGFHWGEVTCKACLKLKPADDLNHKLAGDMTTLCGKRTKLRINGLSMGDSWRFSHISEDWCPKCLAKKPETICVVSYDQDYLPWAFNIAPGDKRWNGTTVCGKPAKAGDVDRYDAMPTCRECLAANPHPVHLKSSTNKKAVVCGAKWSTSLCPTASPEFVTCVQCIDMLRVPAVHELLEDAAFGLMANGLVAARNSGKTIVRDNCGCTAKRPSEHSDRRCAVCAVLEFRDLKPSNYDVEVAGAKLLGVPEEWITDAIRGWDGDSATGLTYPTAYKIGKKLWRKYQ